MKEKSVSQIKSIIHDESLFKSMRIDLLRACLMSLFAAIVLLLLIIYTLNYDQGLKLYLYLVSGFLGLLLVLRKPGRPTQFNRNTFGIPKEYTDYEKKLESVILALRNRVIVVMATTPYFLWLLYLISKEEFSTRNDIMTLFGSIIFSFFVTSFIASTIQYLQIWWSLGTRKNIDQNQLSEKK